MSSFARGSLVVATLLACCGVALAGNPQNAKNTNSHTTSAHNASNTESFQQNNKPVAFRLFTNAVNSLREPNAGTNQLTPEQIQKIDSITKTFNQKLVDFRNQHQSEFTNFKQFFPETGSKNTNSTPAVTRTKVNGTTLVALTPTPSKPSFTAEQTKAQYNAQVAMLKLNQQAPKVSEVFPQVWNVLNASQRAAVTSNIESARNQWAKQHPNQFAKANSNTNGFSAANLPADQRERFQNMSASERQKFAKQWRENRQSNAGNDQ